MSSLVRAVLVRRVLGQVPWDAKGFPANNSGDGIVRVPTLFVCGTEDTTILCSRPYANKSANYVVGADYAYMQAFAPHSRHCTAICQGATPRSRAL